MAPYAKSPEEGEVIAAEAGVFRQPFQLARIAAADDHIVGLEQCAELRHDFVDGTTPFLAAQSLESALADVVFVSASLPVQQMPSSMGATTPSTIMAEPKPVPSPRNNILPPS